MKGKGCAIAAAFVAILVTIAIKVSPSDGDVATWGVIHHPELGDAYLRGEYLGRGLDRWIGYLAHKDANDQWHVYLNPAVPSPWRKGHLQVEGKVIQIHGESEILAEYDTASGVMTFKEDGTTLSREEGLSRAGKFAEDYSLPGQRSPWWRRLLDLDL